MKTGLNTLLLVVALIMMGCNDDNAPQKSINEHENSPHGHAHDMPPITQYFSQDITISDSLVDCTLSDGSRSHCYLVTIPANHDIGHDKGPWCPRNISDDASQSGIWLEEGKVYDADGNFIENLSTFYADDNWALYNVKTGEVKVTDSKDACLAAARPDVDPEYQNHCVECLPEYVESDLEDVQYVIPATPKRSGITQDFNPHSGMGIAFNGVKMDAPAPVDAILGAYTLAPFDDCGGHINPHVGYHYHAMTDCSSVDTAKTEHGKILGVAFDGFAIFSNTLTDGSTPDSLDACGGHDEQPMGYHYHAADPGKNQILGCFVAPQGCEVRDDSYQCDAPMGGPRGPKGQRPPPPNHH